MTDDGLDPAAATARRFVRARRIAVLIALLQFTAVGGLGLDAAVASAVYAGLVLLGLGNEVLARLPAQRWTDDRLVVGAIAADAVVLLGLVLALAVDPSSSTYVLLVLVPVEASLHYGVRGASLGVAFAVAGVVLREFAEVPYGGTAVPTDVTFRSGVLVVVAYAVALAVRERDEARDRTEAALAEARSSDAWRRRLVAALAHDVRAPLAGARSSLELLGERAGQLPADRVTAVARAGMRQTDRGMLLARDLLDMASAEHGGLELATEPVEVAPVVADVAWLAGDDPTTDVPAGLRVLADRDRLEQLLFDLVDNAQRHGAPPVEVTARRVDERVELVVRDHGPGVPPDLALFEAFVPGEDTGSTGIGLWLVRTLAEAQDGRVRHEPADPGARFVVTLRAADDGTATG